VTLSLAPFSPLRLRNDLYCVEWGVKLYSLTHPLLSRPSLPFSCWRGKLFDLLQHLMWRPTWTPDQLAHLVSARQPGGSVRACSTAFNGTRRLVKSLLRPCQHNKLSDSVWCTHSRTEDNIIYNPVYTSVSEIAMTVNYGQFVTCQLVCEHLCENDAWLMGWLQKKCGNFKQRRTGSLNPPWISRKCQQFWSTVGNTVDSSLQWRSQGFVTGGA